jgi:hypothetical protein
LDTSGEFEELKSAFSGLASNIIRLFFVDTLTCGSGGAAGCAEIGGNDIVVNSTYAANASWGHVLIAHEIDHNLNLGHNSTTGNVMRNRVDNAANVDFLPDQITTIGISLLIQNDGSRNSGQRFISITPILVTAAAAVPIPGAIVLFFSAIASIGVFGRKNNQHNHHA